VTLTSAGSVPAEAKGSREFRLVARTAHASYFAQGRGRVDVERSEAFLARLFELFGPAPEGWRFEYYAHRASDGVRAESGAHAVGLTDLDRNRIDSLRAFHPHELVHAVAGRLGRCPVFFAEGLAVALTSEGRWGDHDVDAIAASALRSGRSLEPYLTSFGEQDPDLSYPLAGSFVAFLLDRHGIEPFLAFLRACEASSRRYETAFRRAFGRSVARATIEWRAALDRGEGASWAWADTRSWPEALRSGAPVSPEPSGTVVAGFAEAAGAPSPGAVLLSAEPGWPAALSAPAR